MTKLWPMHAFITNTPNDQNNFFLYIKAYRVNIELEFLKMGTVFQIVGIACQFCLISIFKTVV